MRSALCVVVCALLSLIVSVNAAERKLPVDEIANWDAVSKELLPKVMEANLDMATVLRYIRGAGCTINVSITPPGKSPLSGRLKYSWEDSNDDGMLSQTEVTVETLHVSDMTMRALMSDIHQALRKIATVNTRTYVLKYNATTEKTSEGYLMTLKAKKGDEDPFHLTISRDFRIMKTQTRTPEGNDTTTTYTHRKVGNAWLVTGSVTNTVIPGGVFSSEDRWTNTYDFQGQIPLLREVSMTSVTGGIAGVYRFQQRYTFGDWKVTKRDQPLEIPGTEVAKTDVGEEVNIPKTEEAAQLATQVIRSVQKSYFSLLYSTNVSGVEAGYAFTDLLGHKADVQVKWSRQNERAMASQVEGDLEAAQEKVVRMMAANDLLRTLALGPFRGAIGAGVYAVQSGNEYILDISEWAKLTSTPYSVQLFFVSADLSKVRMLVIFKDGVVEETRFEGEQADGTFYVSRSSVTTRQPGAEESKLDYTWTYTRREGNVFVKRLELVGRLNTFTLELQDVRFEEGGTPVVTRTEAVLTEEPQVTIPSIEEARKLAQETNIPRTKESKRLARQVIQSVQQKYHSVFHSTSASAFDVTASVKKDDYDVGNIKITWKRDDPEDVDAKAEKKVEDPVAMLIQGVATELAAIDVLMPFVLNPLRSAQAPEGYAVKSGGLYIVDLTEGSQNENLKAHVLCVAQDFSRVQEISSYKDGDVLQSVFNGEAADGTFFISSATQPVSPPLGGDYEPTKFSWTYTRKGGGVFIKRAEVEQPLMGQVMHWTIEFGDVTLQGGQAVQKIPEDIQKIREQHLKDLDEQTRKALDEAMKDVLEKLKEE